MIRNFSSISSDTDETSDPAGLAGTKRWRIEWWRKIVSYTIFGDRIWTGKGFGINLATEDGFQLESGLLRSPHNSHLTVLARTGVPGIALYVLFQVLWLFHLARAYARSAHRGERHWQGIFGVLLSYFVAYNINAAFDVSFEGPMSAVWFWGVVGLGIGLAGRYGRPLVAAQRPIWGVRSGRWRWKFAQGHRSAQSL